MTGLQSVRAGLVARRCARTPVHSVAQIGDAEMRCEGPECKVEIEQVHSRHVFCSEKCLNLHELAERRWEHWRRAFGLTREEVEGWVDTHLCHLCGEPIMWASKGRWSPSVEHVVPRALGGTNNPENLSFSHRGCNSRRKHRSSVDWWLGELDDGDPLRRKLLKELASGGA